MDIGGASWGIVKEYSKRKNSIVKIKEDRIVFDISLYMNREEQFRAFENLKKRIIRKIEKSRIRPKQKNEIKNGDMLKIGNEDYKVLINYDENSKTSIGKIENNIIKLFISKKSHTDELLRKLISNKRLPELKKIVKELNSKHFNINFNEIKFRKQTSRWGSCSKKGNINISHRLIFAPADILEYVCVHELAHLREFNHSRRFWELVGKAVPNYKEKELWLKNNGHNLML